MNTSENRWKYDAVRPPPRGQDPERQQAMQLVDGALKKLPGKPDFVLIVLSNDDKVFYSALK